MTEIKSMKSRIEELAQKGELHINFWDDGRNDNFSEGIR
jgi:hypothetical protein